MPSASWEPGSSLLSIPTAAPSDDASFIVVESTDTDPTDDGESEVGIMPRDPKGGKGGGGGKGGKGKSAGDKKAERRKTKFGEAFVGRYNTESTAALINTLRRVPLAKRDEQDPRRATLQELLDLLYFELQFNQKGNDGHYDAMKRSLVTAITPEGTPLNDEDVYAVADAFDATVAWTEGEDESAASVPGVAMGSIIVGVGALAFAIGGSM